jgi:hypothetical protein
MRARTDICKKAALHRKWQRLCQEQKTLINESPRRQLSWLSLRPVWTQNSISRFGWLSVSKTIKNCYDGTAGKGEDQYLEVPPPGRCIKTRCGNTMRRVCAFDSRWNAAISS